MFNRTMKGCSNNLAYWEIFKLKKGFIYDYPLDCAAALIISPSNDTRLAKVNVRVTRNTTFPKNVTQVKSTAI